MAGSHKASRGGPFILVTNTRLQDHEPELHHSKGRNRTDAERLEVLTGHLRQELLDLDVCDVQPLRQGEVPSGARAFDVITVGGLVVSLINSDALRAVVATVRSWLTRGQPTTHAVRLELDGDAIDLSAASTAEQERLIELFVTRHEAGRDGRSANVKP